MNWLQFVAVLLLVLQAIIQFSLAQSDIIWPVYVKYLFGAVGVGITVANSYLPPPTRPSARVDRAIRATKQHG